jgi:hypothetical protein
MPKPKTTGPIRDEVRDFVRKSEEALVDARKRWSETVRDLVPEDGARVRKVVDDAFDFTARLLENQREFAHSVLDAVLGEAAPKQPATTKRAAPSKRAGTTKRAAKPKTATPASAA